MIDLLFRPAADAFLQVGVWVAVMLAVFGVVQWRTAGAAADRGSAAVATVPALLVGSLLVLGGA